MVEALMTIKKYYIKTNINHNTYKYKMVVSKAAGTVNRFTYNKVIFFLLV